MTSVLQPLYVSVNKSMKVALRQKWNAWMNGSVTTLLPWYQMRKPELNTIWTWIWYVWDKLDSEIIVFILIQEMLHGSEDDILWEDGHACAAEESDDDAVWSKWHCVRGWKRWWHTRLHPQRHLPYIWWWQWWGRIWRDFDMRVTHVVNITETTQCYKNRADFYVPQI